ncbi:unnamed protein product [Euphydryas editha]|uniref:Lipase n=1 Tax=Euphydryas editha TaxID=104508 RepID=A0AAU9UCS0_EUPED|nr:unnamed protein product [Euphydryas editha]
MSHSTILLATIFAFVIFKINIIFAYQTDDESFNEVPSLYKFYNFTPPSFISLAIENGYPAEQYDVTTEDGYILTLFHIPGKSRYPIFLLHGLADSSDTWIMRGRTSLAVALASRGYDIWFGNSRGNRYSRRHIRLDPDKDDEFWDFSFNEVGYYDIPALVDMILSETGAPSLTAIGHSQGTTSFYVFGSTRPEYNEKINLMISLAPVCYFEHAVPPLSTFFKNAPYVIDFFTKINIQEVLGDTNLASHIYRVLCSTPVVGYEICLNRIIFPFTGHDPAELEPSFYSPTNIKHYPAGTSVKSVYHYLQVGHTNVFKQYDYGSEENLAHYNSTVPPLYDFSKITMPIAMIVGRNDRLSMIPDVLRLRDQLPNVVYYAVSPRVKFNHFDHTWGRRMRIYLFPYIFNVLERYNGFD